MNDTIKFLGEQTNQAEVRLHREVMDLENHMNECECDNAVKYDFSNTLPSNEDKVYCLNCGGMIPRLYLEDLE
jgi:hypothetical protein